MAHDRGYSALLVDTLTPVYDIFARLLLPEKRFKSDLILQVRIAPGERVLILGAGAGTLAMRQYATLFGTISIVSGQTP